MSGTNGNGSHPRLLTAGDMLHTDDLSDQQRVFADAYLETWNATEAARRAGIAWPNQNGWRWLQNAVIRRCISEALEATHIGARHVLSRLGEQANGNVMVYVDKAGNDLLLTTVVIPEPSVLALVGLGLSGFVLLRRRWS